MARPIEPTPTLKGKDAERLIKSVEKSEFDQSKAQRIEEARKTYRAVKKNWHTLPSNQSPK